MARSDSKGKKTGLAKSLETISESTGIFEKSKENLANQFAVLFAELEKLPEDEKESILDTIKQHVDPLKQKQHGGGAYKWMHEEDGYEQRVSISEASENESEVGVRSRKDSQECGSPFHPEKCSKTVEKMHLPNITLEKKPTLRTYTRKRPKGKPDGIPPELKHNIVQELRLKENVPANLEDPFEIKREAEGQGFSHIVTRSKANPNGLVSGEEDIIFDFGNEVEVQNIIEDKDIDAEEMIMEEMSHSSFELESSDEEVERTRRRRSERSRKEGSHSAKGDGALVCSIEGCGFFAKYPSRLAVHMAKHTGEKAFKCSTCSKSFSQKSTLTQHEKKHSGVILAQYEKGYSDIFPLTCEDCGYSAGSLTDMEEHLNGCRPTDSFICELCGIQLSDTKTLKSHVSLEHGAPEQCKQCGFEGTPSQLREHRKQVHGKGVATCPVCSKEIVQSFLLTHMKQHAAERSHLCPDCGKGFTSQRYLASHLKRHHGDRRFQCAMCGKAFESLAKLQRHELVHSNYKPYGCPFCSYRANVKDNVCKHARALHHVLDFNASQVLVAQSSIKNAAEINTLLEVYDENDGELLVLPRKSNASAVKVDVPVTHVLKRLEKTLGRPVTLEELKAKEEAKQKLTMEKRRNALSS